MERVKSDHDFQSSNACARSAHPDPASVRLRVECPLCRTIVEKRATDGPAQWTCHHCGLRFQGDSVAPGGQPTPNRKASGLAPLDRWLAGEPIQVSAPSNGQRMARWCRKHVGATALAASAAVLLLAGAVVGAVGYTATTSQLHHVERARFEAEQKRRAAEQIAAKQGRLAVKRKRELEAVRRQAEAHRAAREDVERRLHETERLRAQAEQERLLAEQRRLDAAEDAGQEPVRREYVEPPGAQDAPRINRLRMAVQ